MQLNTRDAPLYGLIGQVETHFFFSIDHFLSSPLIAITLFTNLGHFKLYFPSVA